MEFYSPLLILLSLVTLSASEGNSIRIASSGSYTDTLLNGIRRLENQQARRTAAAVGSVVANTALEECYPRCPIGTVCSTQFGIRRCVAAPVVTSASFGTGYNDPRIASAASIGRFFGEPAFEVVGSGYSDPALSAVGLRGLGYNDAVLPVIGDFDGGFVISGGANFGVVGTGLGAGSGYVINGGRLIGCGIIPSDCRANQASPGFPAFKFTFDYTLNQCVRITVCSTCALISGPQDNLFNSLMSCNRYCRQ